MNVLIGGGGVVSDADKTGMEVMRRIERRKIWSLRGNGSIVVAVGINMTYLCVLLLTRARSQKKKEGRGQ